MLRSRRLSYLVGAATLWLPLYLLVFIAYAASVALSMWDDTADDGPPPAFWVFVALHVVTIALNLALLAVYLVDVVRNPDLDGQDARTLWILLVILLGSFAMAVYWWRHLRPSTPPFQRRSQSTHSEGTMVG